MGALPDNDPIICHLNPLSISPHSYSSITSNYPGAAKGGESFLSLIAMYIQPLSVRSYSMTSWLEFPWNCEDARRSIDRTDPKPMVYMGPCVLRGQVACEPVVSQLAVS